MIFLSKHFTPKIIVNNRDDGPSHLIVTLKDLDTVVGAIHKMGGYRLEEYGISSQKGYCFSLDFLQKVWLMWVARGEFCGEQHVRGIQDV